MVVPIVASEFAGRSAWLPPGYQLRRAHSARAQERNKSTTLRHSGIPPATPMPASVAKRRKCSLRQVVCRGHRSTDGVPVRVIGSHVAPCGVVQTEGLFVDLTSLYRPRQPNLDYPRR